jgi:hypothetical protein
MIHAQRVRGPSAMNSFASLSAAAGGTSMAESKHVTPWLRLVFCYPTSLAHTPSETKFDSRRNKAWVQSNVRFHWSAPIDEAMRIDR